VVWYVLQGDDSRGVFQVVDNHPWVGNFYEEMKYVEDN
jgi:hypothetical protein